MIGEFCTRVAETTKLGGNVLVPCYPSGKELVFFILSKTFDVNDNSGIIYDLIECLSMQMDNSGLSNIPMFFVSPVADASLAYANIMAEWLSANKQVRNNHR